MLRCTNKVFLGAEEDVHDRLLTGCNIIASARQLFDLFERVPVQSQRHVQLETRHGHSQHRENGNKWTAVRLFFSDANPSIITTQCFGLLSRVNRSMDFVKAPNVFFTFNACYVHGRLKWFVAVCRPSSFWRRVGQRMHDPLVFL
jgi:hypothetical protein